MTEDLLLKLCLEDENKNKFSSFFPSHEITPRAKFIKNKLNEYGIKVKVDKIEYPIESIIVIDETLKQFYLSMGIKKTKKLYYYNLEVFFKSKNKNAKTIVFIAHHDIENPLSENCQDNTASVVNLINLCKKIKDSNFDKNVLIAFTDSEEKGMKGSRRLATRINELVFGEVEYVINCELTAWGDKFWIEDKEGHNIIYNKLDDSNIEYVLKKCPNNDAFEIRRHGIKSLCCGILSNEEVYDVSPLEWKKCHLVNDVYADHDKKHMNNFVDILFKMI